MMRKGIIFIALALTLMGCNNYFHDLIPSDENRILSFSVEEGMIGRAVIADNTVDAVVDNKSDLSSLLPRIGISRQATLIPLTYEYLSAAFPSEDILQESAAVYRARDISAYVLDLIRRNPDFNVPALNEPIDFSFPVHFLVISGQGTIRQYTIHVVKDTGEPRILGFGFSKYDNAELIRDAFTSVNHNAKTVDAKVLYPMEMYVSYSLIPSFELFEREGDQCRLEIDGVEIRSGVDSIQFAQALGTQTKTLTVWRNGVSADYTLTVDFSEDPDSIRSITDFRFTKTKTDNAGIAATAVGSIINNNALGTIRVQVFYYAGARPSSLIPSFISPGTVSVGGATQITGVSSHDFSQALEYRVVSRNNLYTRTYTVIVEFIDVEASAPVFTSFKFSSGLNPDLVQDTESQISDSANLIMITARYGGTYPPEMLIPEFRATGLVTVFGSVQTSGFSAQNFSTQIKYTVANPENPISKREYWVQVTFIRDTSSAASINSFSFHPDENPGLADELEGRIDQAAGTITVFAPIGSGITSRTMIPRFRASGQVSVEGSVQISESSGHLFNAPVVYEAVSANGVNRKIYTVTMRELTSTMYVNPNAFLGMGDGTSWADAFRDLGTACEAAALFPEDVPKEIWIAAGTYKPSATDREKYFALTANTSYIGGFAGNETAKSQRNIAANKTVISGDLGGGEYASNLFGKFNGDTAATINGDLSFDGLEFTAANATGVNDDRGDGAAIGARLSSGGELRITDCNFNNVQANQGAVYVIGGGLVISSANFGDITSVSDGGAVYGTGLSAVRIDNVDLRNIDTAGLYFNNCSGDMEINSVNLQEITGNGIRIEGGSGKKELSNITGCNIKSYVVFVNGGDITLAGSSFNNAMGIFTISPSSVVRIIDTEIKNSITGIFAIGRNMVIENVIAENITNGTVMSFAIANNGALRVSGSTIKDIRGSGSNGISLSGSGSAVISNTTIKNIESCLYAIYAVMTGDLTIIDSTIDTGAPTYGLHLAGSGNTVISNTTINNINTYFSGYAMYVEDRRLVITDTTMNNITARYGIWGQNLSSVEINGLTLRDIYGNGLFFDNCYGDMKINNVDLQNISSYGIFIDGGSDKKELSNITGYNIANGILITNGNGNITLAESSFDTSGGIHLVSYGSINISDTTTKNVFGSNAIHIANTGNAVIERVNVENVPNGRGIYLSLGNRGSASAQITNCSIKNCTVVGDDVGGGIFLQCCPSAVITGTIIDNVRAYNGGAICVSYYSTDPTTLYNSDVTISNSTIKNANASYGGGIYYNMTGSMTISSTTIEDVSAISGGGIYTNAQLNLYDTTIKNASAVSGGGIHYSSNQPFVIDGSANGGSRFENCRADGGYGAICIGVANLVSHKITNTTFLNCTARNGPKFMNTSNDRPVNFRGCTFEDNDALYNYDVPANHTGFPMFGLGARGDFENCTFNNLKSSRNGNFIFSRTYCHYTAAELAAAGNMGLQYFGGSFNVTLRNCTFNFGAGSAGLCAGDENRPDENGGSDYLLMDGVTINDNGGQKPLIWLDRSSAGTPVLQVKLNNPNNLYNGTPINAATILTLVPSGVVKLTRGAMPAVVP